MESDVQLTDAMVQNIVDNVAKKIANRMIKEDKYEEEELLELQEWKDAVEFYKQLVKADESLGNMFSRRLDKALTQSIRIAPNIQRYVLKNG
jgi:hemoglobin-like flavoprotein